MTETRGSTAAPESGRPPADDESVDEVTRDGAAKVLGGGSKTRTRTGESKTSTRDSKRRASKSKDDVALRRATVTRASRKKKAAKRRIRPGLFLRQIVAELRKVVWPTRHELTTYTSVVIVFVAIIIAIVSALDFGISKAILAVFG